MAILIYAHKGSDSVCEKQMTTKEAYKASERARSNPEYFALYWTEGSGRSIDDVRTAVLRLANQTQQPVQPKPVIPQAKIVVTWTAKKAEHHLQFTARADADAAVMALKASGHAAKIIE